MSSTTLDRKVTRSDFGKNQFLDPKVIKVDKNYQRENTSIVGKIVANFDEKRFEPLTISERTWLTRKGAAKHYYAVDGYNRLSAALRLGLKEVPVRIVPTASVEEEAALFVELNRNRVTVPFNATHRAHVFSGDETATAVESAVNSVGFTLIKDKVDTNTRLLKIANPLYHVYSQGNKSQWALPGYKNTPLYLDGTKLIQVTLDLIDKTWGMRKTAPQAWNGNTVRALASFLEKFWEDLSLADVRKLMQVYSAGDMATEASSMSNAANNYSWRAVAFTKQFNALHNRRLRYQAAFPELFKD